MNEQLLSYLEADDNASYDVGNGFAPTRSAIDVQLTIMQRALDALEYGEHPLRQPQLMAVKQLRRAVCAMVDATRVQS